MTDRQKRGRAPRIANKRQMPLLLKGPGCPRILHPDGAATLAVLMLAVLSTLSISAQTFPAGGWPAAEIRLASLLSGNSEQKRTALAEIRNIRTEEASRLAVPALSDRDEIVRATAASSIIFLPADDAARALEPMLDDKQAFVRREAAYALGQVGHSSANGRLLRTMTADRDLEVRAAAAVAIGNIGDPASIESLLTVLDKRPREEEEFLRRSAARAVGQIFEQAAKGSTSTLTPQNFLPPEFKDVETENPPVRVMNVGQLGKITSTLEKIVRSRDEANDTRREAAFALGAMRRPESAVLLRSLLTSPDPYLAEISKEALLKIESKELSRGSDN